MTVESTEKGANKPGFSRIALIFAGLVAILAVGVTVWKKSSTGDSAAAATADAPAGDVNTRIATLEARLKDNPNDAEGWRMLGWALFSQEKFAEAASAYGRATQLVPDKADYWSSLGESRLMAGDGKGIPADAQKAFDKALSLDPKDPRARYFMGAAKDMAGNHKGAIDDWFALLADTPKGAPWEQDVRNIITQVGKAHKIEVASRFAKLRPPSPPTEGGAAIAAAPIPGPSTADMRNAASLPKGQQDAMVQGMVEGLEKKLKANPDNPNGWIMLMRSRMTLGETAKAAQALKDARTAFAGNQQKLEMVNSAAGELGVAGR